MKPLSLLCSFANQGRLLGVTVTLLLWQPATALPLLSEISPYSMNVVANGYASKKDESALFYTEAYLDDPTNSTVRASYWSVNREPIAYKQLDFGDNPNVPEQFEVIDYRRKTAYRVTVNNNVANVKILTVSENGSETIKLDKDVKIDANTVIDAAFHRLIISSWDELTNGKAIKIKFLRIDKARLVPLKIKQTYCDTPDTACFKISFDNFLLQGVVPTIFMQYEASSKRLIHYNGIGPITQMNGKGLPVDIKYEYLQ